jgi:hypothetical protein
MFKLSAHYCTGFSILMDKTGLPNVSFTGGAGLLTTIIRPKRLMARNLNFCAAVASSGAAVVGRPIFV